MLDSKKKTDDIVTAGGDPAFFPVVDTPELPGHRQYERSSFFDKIDSLREKHKMEGRRTIPRKAKSHLSIEDEVFVKPGGEAERGINLHRDTDLGLGDNTNAQTNDPAFDIPRQCITSWGKDIPQLCYNMAYTRLPALTWLRALSDYNGEALTEQHKQAICALINLPDHALKSRFFIPQNELEPSEEIYKTMHSAEGEQPYAKIVKEYHQLNDGNTEAAGDADVAYESGLEPGKGPFVDVPSPAILYAYNAMGDYLRHFLPMSGLYKAGAGSSAEVLDDGSGRTLQLYSPDDYIAWDSIKPAIGEGYDMLYKVITRANTLFQHAEAGSKKQQITPETINDALQEMGQEPEAALRTFAAFFRDAAQAMEITPETTNNELIQKLEDQVRSQMVNAIALTVHYLGDEHYNTATGLRVSLMDIHFCQWWADKRMQAKQAGLPSFPAEDALVEQINNKYRGWVSQRMLKTLSPEEARNEKEPLKNRIMYGRYSGIDSGSDYSLYFPWTFVGWREDGAPNIISSTENREILWGAMPSANYHPRSCVNDYAASIIQKYNQFTSDRQYLFYQRVFSGEWFKPDEQFNFERWRTMLFSPKYGWPGLGYMYPADEIIKESKELYDNGMYDGLTEFYEHANKKGIMGLFAPYIEHPAIEGAYVNRRHDAPLPKFQETLKDAIENEHWAKKENWGKIMTARLDGRRSGDLLVDF